MLGFFPGSKDSKALKQSKMVNDERDSKDIMQKNACETEESL